MATTTHTAHTARDAFVADMRSRARGQAVRDLYRAAARAAERHGLDAEYIQWAVHGAARRSTATAAAKHAATQAIVAAYTKAAS